MSRQDASVAVGDGTVGHLGEFLTERSDSILSDPRSEQDRNP